MAVLKYKSGNEIKTIPLTKSGTSGVSSVNGKTGKVTGVYDVDNQPPYPVKSVNGKTGAVTGLYSAENKPPYPVTSVNGKTGDVTGLYSEENKPPYPVTSVNGKTGAVTGLYDQNNQPPYPVTSVNGKTGAVLTDFFENSLEYSIGLVVPPGLSIIYDIPILTSGSLTKGNTIVAHVHVSGLGNYDSIDPISVIAYNNYLQATPCWENDGFSITFTSQAIEGGITNISCEVVVYSKVQFTIQSIEVN